MSTLQVVERPSFCFTLHHLLYLARSSNRILSTGFLHGSTQKRILALGGIKHNSHTHNFILKVSRLYEILQKTEGTLISDVIQFDNSSICSFPGTDLNMRKNSKMMTYKTASNPSIKCYIGIYRSSLMIYGSS
jgi:hypothetical protein